MHAACYCGFQILAHQLHFGDNLSPWSKALTKKVNFRSPWESICDPQLPRTDH
jgi:hypothetical protein